MVRSALGRTGLVGPASLPGPAIVVRLFRQIIAGRGSSRAEIIVVLVRVVIVISGQARIVFGDDGFADIVTVDILRVAEFTADFFFCFALTGAEAELFFTVFDDAF